MATRGRKPKPSHLHLVAGNPGKRAPRKGTEPMPPRAEPTVPPHLSDDAKVEWGRVIGILCGVGMMTEVDRAALAAYCQSYGRWVQAERALAAMAEKDPITFGLLAKTTNKNVVQNPLVGAANRAMEIMLRAAAEFGMTPSARTRIDVSFQTPAPQAAVAGRRGGAAPADEFFR